MLIGKQNYLKSGLQFFLSLSVIVVRLIIKIIVKITVIVVKVIIVTVTVVMLEK